ncbi:hypothetical protein TNCV_263241 [Trichonephila clavipes]|nr:hypothetical protein TNCV_263241 [Trichonephila clavipes]
MELTYYGSPFYIRRIGSVKNRESPKETSKSIIPELLPAMAAPNSEVKLSWRTDSVRGTTAHEGQGVLYPSHCK